MVVDDELMLFAAVPGINILHIFRNFVSSANNLEYHSSKNS